MDKQLILAGSAQDAGRQGQVAAPSRAGGQEAAAADINSMQRGFAMVSALRSNNRVA